MAKEMGIHDVDIYNDSKLVIHQLLDDYDVKKEDLVPYHKHAMQLLSEFKSAVMEHVPRSANKVADALANLAATLALGEEDYLSVPVCNRWVVTPPEFGTEEAANAVFVYEISEEDWRQPLVDYLKHGKLPDDVKHRMEIRRRVARFIYYKGTLHKRSFLATWWICLGEEEAQKVMEEAHSGFCGAHQSGPKLHDRIKRLGYYWPTMVQDCMDYAKRCEACQFHVNFIHQPPEPFHPTVTSWPFKAWGLDVNGPITPKSSGGHAYILATTDYFLKWAEAVALREVKKENVVEFIRNQIIFRYGVPRYVITDNGMPFFNKLIMSLCEKFKFKQRNRQCTMPQQMD
ncbi:Gypsy retrotransposon integrase-like protein 1 [Bienertia sinuspersici]